MTTKKIKESPNGTKPCGTGASPVVTTTTALLNRTEAAAYLGVKPQTLAVWAMTQRYNLPMVKVGRLVKYRLADLDAFIASRTVGRLDG